MVSTSRIEVFEVKPDLHFSFVINSFHNDLFSQRIQRVFLYFRKRHSCTRQEAPRKHPGGTQEAPPRRHPGAEGASRGIWLINRHHYWTKCKKHTQLMILLCVFEGPTRIRCYLQGKMRRRSDNVAPDSSRPLYQHRKNPYSWRLFGEQWIFCQTEIKKWPDFCTKGCHHADGIG